MKRPEGFDRTPPAQSAVPASRGPSSAKRGARPRDAERAPRGSSGQRGSRPGDPDRGVDARPKAATRPAGAPKPPKDTAGADARREAAHARAEARRAAAERRRYERAEIKRFTARARARRIALSVTLGTVGVVVLLVLVAIFSPILALRTVSVAGANRVDGAAVAAVVEEQLGTPLALIDYGRLDAGLRAFPVIRSYTTEVVPPDTMVVHLVEREPVVTIASPAGDFLFVDAAGVTVQASKERLPGVPLVTESGTALPNPAFDAAVEVLLAMPDELRGQIDTITAKTRDDVWLTFAGVTQAVKWGSADDSATKVRLLEVLRANFGATPGTFDVSATGNGIFRPA